MKITIQNTDKIVEVNGVPARIWEGETDSGVPVICHVNLITPQTHDPDATAQFERELREVHPASDAANRCFDLRYFLD